MSRIFKLHEIELSGNNLTSLMLDSVLPITDSDDNLRTGRGNIKLEFLSLFEALESHEGVEITFQRTRLRVNSRRADN